MIACRAIVLMLLGASIFACRSTPAPEPPALAPPALPEPPAAEASPPASAEAPALPEPPVACAADADCGYDPARDRCTAEPGANRQPPLVDQGLVCYCDAQRCALLRVAPVPCESDASCAVRLDPRPHPVASSPAYPHERGRPCRDFTLSTTCERTNICTMHRLACRGSAR